MMSVRVFECVRVTPLWHCTESLEKEGLPSCECLHGGWGRVLEG